MCGHKQINTDFRTFEIEIEKFHIPAPLSKWELTGCGSASRVLSPCRARQAAREGHFRFALRRCAAFAGLFDQPSCSFETYVYVLQTSGRERF